MKRLMAALVVLAIFCSPALHGFQTAQTSTSAQSQPRSTPTPTQHSHYYTNSDGQKVPSPERSSTVPAGATAQCKDGSYSFSQHHRGTCSHHGGVAKWLTQ